MKLYVALIIAFCCFQESPYNKERVTTKKQANLEMTEYRGIRYKDIVYYVENSLETITAYNKDGSIRWQVDMDKVFKCNYVGIPGVRFIMIGNQMVYGDVFGIKNNELFVVYAKHDFAKINIDTGVATYLGAD